MTPAEIASLLLEQSSQPDFPQTFQQLAPQFTPAVLSEIIKHIADERFRNAQKAMQFVEVAEQVAHSLGTAEAQGRATWMRGAILVYLNYYREALVHFQKAESFYQQEGDDFFVAGLQVNQVACLCNLGDYSAALNQEAKARATCKAVGERALDYLANLEGMVGQVYEEMGQVEAALAAYDRGRAIYVQQGKTISIAGIDMNRANALFKTDRFWEAETWLQAAITTYKESGYDQSVARAELNWGMLAYRTGQYQAALQHLDIAHHLFAAIPLPAEVALANLERAFVYGQLHLFREMLTLAVDAEKVFRRYHSRREHNRSLVYQAIAYQQLGLLEMAEKKLNQARRSLRQQMALARLWELDVQRARLYEVMNQPDRAGRIARRLSQEIDPTRIPSAAGQARLLLARWYITRGKWTQAETQLHMVHTLAQTYHLTELEIETAHTTAWMQEKRGQLTAALRQYQQAIRLAQRLQTFFSLDELQLGFDESKQPIYQDAVRLTYQLVQAEKLPLPYLLATLEQAQAAPLVQVPTETDPDNPSPWQAQLAELRQRWQWYQGSGDIFPSSGQEQTSSESRLAERQQQLAQLEAEITELQRRERVWWSVGREEPVASTDPAIEEGLSSDERLSSKESPAPDQLLAQLQRHLLPGEGLLHYFVVQEQLQAILVTAESIQLIPHLTPLTPLQRRLKAWRFHIQHAQTAGHMVEGNHQQALAYLYELHQLVLAPLQPHLADLHHLYLVLPPDYHDLPLAALFDGQRYFIETCQLSYLSTLSALWRKPAVPSGQEQPAVVVGFSDDGRLPHAVAEAQAIHQLFAPTPVICLVEAEATRDAFEAASRQAGIIHLATHALFRPDNPMFSWFRLADDHLTVGDLYHLRLPEAPLVVLSACETGKGQARGGGLSGMGRAFLAAGARGLVVTLWPVGDESTAEWMRQFYQSLSQSPPAIALGMAQREVIQHGRAPFAWAGFLFLAG